MKNKIIFYSLVVAIIVLVVGCSKNNTLENKSGNSMSPAVRLNDTVYHRTVNKVNNEDLEKLLGTVQQKTISKMPEKNWESNELPVGSKIYQIKGKDPKKYVAVELDNAIYEAISFNENENGDI